MSTEFSHRPVVIINAKDADVEVIHPQLAVLMIDNKVAGGKRYLDVGAFCYKCRGRSGAHQVGSPVDLSSLDYARIPVVQGLIEHLRRKVSSATTASEFEAISRFIEWIDTQEQPYAFDDLVSMKKAYGDYTQHLLHRMNSSGINGQSIKSGTAWDYQRAARGVVILATGLSEPEVKGVATHIPRNDGQARHVNLKLPNSDVQARTFAVLVNFIDEAHRLLVQGGAFPLHLVSPSGESIYLYSDHVGTEKSKNANFSLSLLLAASPAFPTWAEVKSNFLFVGDGASTKVENAIYGRARKRYSRNNDDMRSHLRQRIGAHAVTAGALAFIAATSCNLSVAQNLEVDTLEIVPTSQGNRFSGTKGRAKGKVVYPEFGVRFAPVFKKYLELRNWILNGAESTLVFPIPSAQYGFVVVGNNHIKALKSLITKALPNTGWVTPTQWRKNVSYQYLRLSGGDMALAAEKLGNTEATLRQSYSRPALEDFAAEMTVFFESMHQAAIDRTRFVERIPVRITDERRPEAATGIGACEKVPETDPKRAQGFTAQAPTPACGAPETCLFCEFYAVHADEQDIRRLLSLRYLIQAIKHKQPVDHWQSKFGPSLHRIDEVLSAMQDADGSIEATINRVRNEVESGDLDTFWSIHFDTLVTVGAVS
ncbi:hypothetical protein N8H22_06040 [Stutzerimonas stutzeri]|uniref:hypothetical protein n=1 Tax=Stutzerimonas sp. S1 TaxID=3030652 RepID=UPI0022258A90|nr:hypothetical protein [Stutzerimonas sp. S1]MCW3148167.1 hypothetical protein [Stutzerimonas sp. S1]